MKKYLLILLIPILAYAIDRDVTSRDGSVVLNGLTAIKAQINGVDKVRIDSAGKVGIATTAPARLLDINSATGVPAMALAGWDIASWSTNDLRFGGITGAQWASTSFYTAGSEKVKIDSTGNVGIGNTGPLWPIDLPTSQNGTLIRGGTNSGIVAGNFNGEGHISSGQTLSSGGSWTARNTSSADININAGNTGALVFSTNTGNTISAVVSPTERMRIDSDGDVGIGITLTPSKGLNISSLNNYSVAESASDSYFNLYRQFSTAGTIVASGYKTAPGVFWVSSNGSSFAKSAIALSGPSNPGGFSVYTDTATTVPVETSVTPTERMRIDSSGKVGIGLTPSAKFHVGTGTGFGSGIRVSGSNDNAEFYFVGDNEVAIDTRLDGGSSGGNLVLNPSGGSVGIGTSPSEKFHILGGSGNLISKLEKTSHANGENVVYVAKTAGSATVMEIGGYRHAGIVDAAGYLYFRAADGASAYLWHNGGTWYTSNSSSNIGTATGTIVGTQVSDERLKKNITPISYGLTEVLKLKPIKYVMNGKAELGFGAQTTQKIIPEAVYNVGEKIDNSGLPKMAMDYSRITPVTVRAIQELKAENDELKKRLDKLEAKFQ